MRIMRVLLMLELNQRRILQLRKQKKKKLKLKTKSIKVDKNQLKLKNPKLKTKKIVKSFSDEVYVVETSKIILRLIDEDKFTDYTRTFMSGASIYVNKDKIGKRLSMQKINEVK